MFPHPRPGIIRVLTWLSFLLLLIPTPAFAANDTADNALQLSATKSSFSDSLVGSTGGAYRYYRFDYQGGLAPVLVSLTYEPGFAGTGNQPFGFNLYGASGVTYAGVPIGMTGNTTTVQFSLAQTSAMSFLVQVYNYTAGMQIGYSLSVAGLSGGSTQTVVGNGNSTPGQSVAVSTVNASITGRIVGKSSGAYQFYTLNYPGGGSPLTVTMTAFPVYTGQGLAYGFNLYRTDVQGNVVLAASGALKAQDANSTTISASVSQRSAGTYQLQVANYWDSVPVTYSVTTTGLASPPVPASGNTGASHAIVLNSARQGASATLVGARGGAFQYYVVNYPGNQSNFWVSVTYNALGGAPNNALGFNIYNGSTLVATVNPTDDGSGVQSAAWYYQDPNPATFGIQVFNYAPDARASYTIYQVGSQ